MQVSFQVADALKQPFPDGQFDLVWSMESGEHMPDKAKVCFIPINMLHFVVKLSSLFDLLRLMELWHTCYNSLNGAICLLIYSLHPTLAVC